MRTGGSQADEKSAKTEYEMTIECSNCHKYIKPAASQRNKGGMSETTYSGDLGEGLAVLLDAIEDGCTHV